jgi:hypothetical protein
MNAYRTSWRLNAQAALTPGKELPVPIGPVWMTRRRENSRLYPDSNSDHSVVQPVASRYAEYAIPAPTHVDMVVYTLIYLRSWALLQKPPIL